MMNKKGLAVVSSAALALIVAGCGDNNNDTNGGNNTSDTNTGNNSEETSQVVDGDEIELALVNWDSEVASTTTIGLVLEDLGYDVTITPLEANFMFQAIAEGEADAMVAAWLPLTHEELLDQYGADMDDLGVNLSGARTGLVVPAYMDINDISELNDIADELNNTITGIDAGSGAVAAAERSLETYGLEGYTVQTSSGAAMTQALDTAIDNEDPIVVTGWTPHWKFAAYDLKFLNDPEGEFGEAEDIHTFARMGLEEDLPEAYSVLSNFNWTEADMGEIMMDISEGMDEEEAARNWINDNEEKVSEWTQDVTN